MNDAGKIALNDNPAARSYLAGSLELYDKSVKEVALPQMNLSKENLDLYKLSEEVYHRDAHCFPTCHGEDGKGTIPNIYPPLSNNEWVMGDDERLIKIVLKGLWSHRSQRQEVRSIDRRSTDDGIRGHAYR